MTDTPPPGALPATDPATDPWAKLRAATRARIGLGRSGDTMPLGPVLAFQAAHASARDAVHAPLDAEALAARFGPGTILVASAAPDRATYLRRPDLGRVLASASEAALSPGDWDLALVVADGLSAIAAMRHGPQVVDAIRHALPDWKIAPVIVARQARVALGDDIGARLGARMVAVLIGERPGLTVADSLGIYLTRAPSRGRRDSERNCISNIHGVGLSPAGAAQRLAWLAREANRIGGTGIALKDQSSEDRSGGKLLPP